MTTWRKDIEQTMAEYGESFTDIEAAAPPIGDWLDVKFDSGYGSPEGCCFTV